MSLRPIDTVLGHLEGVRDERGAFKALCPAHDDRNPSLGIKEGDDGKVLLTCYANCPTEQVVAAAGLTMSDLFPPDSKQATAERRRIIATYDYVDETWDVVTRKERFEPKGFRQCRPDGRGGWIYKLGDARRVLYRLPDVIAAVAAGEPIYIVEGEKDVETMRKCGYTATCNQGGAGKWSEIPDAPAILTGAHVIVVPDQDAPGLAHARDVVASLHGKAATITVVETAAGYKDISEHVGAGLTVEELSIVAGTEPGDPSLGDWLNEPPPPADNESAPWMVTDLRPAWNGEKPEPVACILVRSDGTRVFLPGINYLFGDSGDGKTWIAGIAALQEIRTGNHVVWITFEDPNELEIVTRFKLLGATAEDVTRLHVIVATEPLTSGIEWLAQLVIATSATLVVLDSIGEALAVEGVDEDRDADFGPWARNTMRRLLDLVPEPPAILPIDHATKAKDNPFYPSGTKRKRAMVTGLMVSLNVRQPFARDRVGRVQLICAKDRSGRFRRGEIVAEVSLDAITDPYLVAVEAPAEGTELVTGRKRKADERVLQVLEASSVPLEAAEIHRLVNEQSTRLPTEGELTLGTVKNAMTKLAKRPNVTTKRVPTGVGNAFRVLYDLDDPAVDHESDGRNSR